MNINGTKIKYFRVSVLTSLKWSRAKAYKKLIRYWYKLQCLLTHHIKNTDCNIRFTLCERCFKDLEKG